LKSEKKAADEQKAKEKAVVKKPLPKDMPKLEPPKPCPYIAVEKEIKEKKAAEAELKAKQKAEEKNSVKAKKTIVKLSPPLKPGEKPKKEPEPPAKSKFCREAQDACDEDMLEKICKNKDGPLKLLPKSFGCRKAEAICKHKTAQCENEKKACKKQEEVCDPVPDFEESAKIKCTGIKLNITDTSIKKDDTTCVKVCKQARMVALEKLAKCNEIKA